MPDALRIVVTGAAGQIGYALLPRLASGEVFGPHTRVILQLLEITPAIRALEGVAMELMDCAFPLLEDVVLTDQVETAFDRANWVLLLGSRPRSKGMERNDLIRDNGPIFVGHGKALARAAGEVRILVVGNPANTNCLIAMSHGSRAGIPRHRFSAMTRLDQNRAQAQLANKAGVSISRVTRVAIWGNHSATQYPDAENARIDGRPAALVIDHQGWLQGEFIETVQQRGAAIIAARGRSSAASAASAVVDHLRSMLDETPAENWFSAAVMSDGSYGIGEGLICSFPLRSDGQGNWTIVQGLEMSDFARQRLKVTVTELLQERSVVTELLA